MNVSYLVVKQGHNDNVSLTIAKNLEKTQVDKSELIVVVDNEALANTLDAEYKDYVVDNRLTIIYLDQQNNWAARVKTAAELAKGKTLYILNDNEFIGEKDEKLLVNFKTESVILDGVKRIGVTKTTLMKNIDFNSPEELVDILTNAKTKKIKVEPVVGVSTPDAFFD